MEQRTDRMRFKDKIIDNISKAIKSIQELVYYQSRDPVLGGSVDGLTLSNTDWPCHKLCENLDHALLHGLKQVTHGYWQVVKQLLHKVTVKEIDVLTNVTTDLGRGRAWLYVSLNEGLLESYIRLLCNNDKLLKKYYVKEALMLDEDRMNILLTHTSGLECVTFHFEYDVPYLDLSACPPRGRTNSEPEDDVTPQSQQGHSKSLHSVPKICASPTESIGHQLSDSDSASVASSDGHTQSEIICPMKISTISADSGCSTDGAFSDDAKLLCVTPVDSIMNIKRVGTSSDSVSLCSVGSTGDPDRHKRLENIIPGGDDEEDGGDAFKVIRVKSKKVNSHKSKKKKQVLLQESDINKNGKTLLADPTESHTGLNYQKANELTSKARSQNRKEEEESDADNVIGKSAFEGDDVVHSDISDENLRKSSSSPESCDGQSDSKIVSASIPKFDSGIDICDMAVSGDTSLTSSIYSSTNAGDRVSVVPLEDKNRLFSGSSTQLPNSSNSVQAQIESKIAELCAVDASGNSSQKASSTGVKSGTSDKPGSNVAKQSSNHISDHKHSSEFPSVACNSAGLSRHSHKELSSPAVSLHSSGADSSNINSQSELKEAFIDPHKHSSHGKQFVHASERGNTQTKENGRNWAESSHETEDNFDVYSSSKQGVSEQQHNGLTLSGALKRKSSGQSATQLKDYMNYILQTPDSPPMDSKDRQEVQEKKTDLSLSLDNNTKLQLMLDIFNHEDEKLLKMFVTRENHTEGESGVVYVLISDHCLYLLHYRQSTKKFVLQSSAKLPDLLFMGTGINKQTLNIESRGKNNQKQRLWLTPGHKELTKAIIKCLTEAVQAASEHVLPGKSGFSVESEVPSQIVALRKYISRELCCEAQDVTISDYSLVFWEDPSSINNQPQDIDALYKEGTLLLRNQDPLKAHVWKPVYVVLKNSMLCISNKKSDPRPHSYLGLGGDQCVGCRSTSTTDREHCVELILAQGGSWFLAAASQAEISEWRHALCLAVSQGTVEHNTLSACIPCCAVLACNHLFLCHEDLHTKFYRTLGRAMLEDVTGIALDAGYPTYSIIEFESLEAGVSSNQWVLYFSSADDLHRCRSAIGAAWRDIYQIDLPVSPVSSIALRRHCCAYSDQLKQQLTLK